jgi:hypothetical protein
MRKLQSTLAQLNENNFDILNNGSMDMIKGGTYCGYSGNNKSKKSKKSKKSRKSPFCGTKPKSAKSLKKIKVRPCGYNPCGW